MALLKQKTDPVTGVVTTYHKIYNAAVREDCLFCVLSSYVSQEYRQNGNSVGSETFHFPITVEEEESMGIRQLGYKKIKELPEWADAENC